MTRGAKIIVATIVILILVSGGYALYKSSKSEVSDVTPEATEPIKIGFMAPLTGDSADIGNNSRAAAEIAKDEINKAGGVGGRQIELVSEDGKCSNGAAVNAIAKLINVDKVSAILGGDCDEETISAAPVAEASKIPMLSYCSTSAKISSAGDYVFRNIPSENSEALYAASYILDTLKFKNIALVHENTDWGTGLSDTFFNATGNSDGKIVITESYKNDAKDFKTILTKVKKSKAEIVYFLGHATSSIVAIKQMKEVGIKIPVFGSSAWDDVTIWNKLGKTGDGMMFTSILTNSTDDFKTLMNAKLGSDKIFNCSNYAYDGLKILVGVIAEKGTGGTAIKDALYKVHYEGGMGQASYDFDDNGDPSNAVYSIKVVKDGVATIKSDDSTPLESTASTTDTTSTSTDSQQ